MNAHGVSAAVNMKKVNIKKEGAMNEQGTEFMKETIVKIIELTRQGKLEWRETFLRRYKATVGDFVVEFDCIRSGGITLEISAAEFKRNQSEEGPDGLIAHLVLKELAETVIGKTVK